MKKRVIPILILIAFLGGYGAVSSLFTVEEQGPVYQEITVADSVFEDKFYFEQLTEEEQPWAHPQVYKGRSFSAQQYVYLFFRPQICWLNRKGKDLLHS